MRFLPPSFIWLCLAGAFSFAASGPASDLQGFEENGQIVSTFQGELIFPGGISRFGRVHLQRRDSGPWFFRHLMLFEPAGSGLDQGLGNHMLVIPGAGKDFLDLAERYQRGRWRNRTGQWEYGVLRAVRIRFRPYSVRFGRTAPVEMLYRFEAVSLQYDGEHGLQWLNRNGVSPVTNLARNCRSFIRQLGQGLVFWNLPPSSLK